MKFILKSSGSSSARIGLISNVVRLPDFEMETPNLFLYTRGGSIPHLTNEVWQMVSKEPASLHLPLTSISNFENQMKLYKDNLAHFVGMKECLTYCTVIDPGEELREGFHKKDYIPVWTSSGRKEYSAETYLSFVETTKPDMFAVISDGDTNSLSSHKRVNKSLIATTELFRKCLEAYNKCENLQKSKMIGVIEGGFNLTAREECSKLIGTSSVFGVVVDGLHNYGKSVSHVNIDGVREVIDASLKHIPSDKLRIIHGSWNPEAALNLIEMGIDIMDTSYPYLISEEGGALIFPNDDKLFEPLSENGHAMNGEPTPKKFKGTADDNQSENFYISLHDSSHSSNFMPISENCTCLTCKNHSRAYIHHLLNVKELLGPLLLMIHNMHHYLKFFSTIRIALKTGKFDEMVKNFATLNRITVEERS